MMDRLISRYLGSGAPDPGCEGAFEMLDEYVEAVMRGDDVRARYQALITHIEGCAACFEDTTGLLAVLNEMKPRSPEK